MSTGKTMKKKIKALGSSLFGMLTGALSLVGIKIAEKRVPRNTEMETTPFHSLELRDLKGEQVSLEKWAGQAILVVNVASRCGFTPQYDGLQELWERYRDRGLLVIGFPSNEFGGQEPGDAEEIGEFCRLNFGVTFPLFEKSTTAPGPTQSPVYRLLGGATGRLPGWNFGKYLVSPEGRSAQFFPSSVSPSSSKLRGAIEAQLG
jgi:glutathione peroxidase